MEIYERKTWRIIKVKIDNSFELERQAYKIATGKELNQWNFQNNFDFDNCEFNEGAYDNDNIIQTLKQYYQDYQAQIIEQEYLPNLPY
jgi:hypothetical protein